MKIYDSNGYISIENILAAGMPFTLVCGGRGTGKTFGALKYAKEHNIKFILMRRTQSQVDLINKPEFCPFKSLNEEYGWNVGTAPISKYNVGFYDMELNSEGKAVPTGAPIGLSVALSTISNLRGFDASDVELLIYDEFIPERHERPIKEEGAAFLNAYETINRNRELKGKKPLQVLCLANANDLGNPIFTELGLIAKAESMKRKGQEFSIIESRGIALFMLNKSPISDKKKNTVLYKLSEGTAFEEMAINNNFEELNSRSIKSMPLSEYKPIVQVGEICIYKHKSNGSYYVSTIVSGTPAKFGTSEVELSRFNRAYFYLYENYMKNNIVFENSMCEVLYNKYI